MSDKILPDDTTDGMEALQPRAFPPPPVPPTPMTPVYQAPMGGATPQPEMVEIDGAEMPGREEQPAIQFAVNKLNDYLQWLLMVLETILGLRFLLKMLGADPTSIFANFIFSLTDVLLVPFRGIAPTISLHAQQAFEFSTIFAAVVYFLLFYALKRFLRIAAE